MMMMSYVVSGERLYEQLQWSSELCTELGYDKDFDLCGVIEFCTSGTAAAATSGGGGRQRKLVLRNHQPRQLQPQRKQPQIKQRKSLRGERRNLRRHKSDHDFHAAKKNKITCGGDSGDGKKKTQAHQQSNYYATHPQPGMMNHNKNSNKTLSSSLSSSTAIETKTSASTTTTTTSMDMEDMEMDDMDMEMEDMDMEEGMDMGDEGDVSAEEKEDEEQDDEDSRDDKQQGEEEDEDEDEGDSEDQVAWSATNNEVFSEEVEEEKEKFQHNHPSTTNSNNNTHTKNNNDDFDLESWLAEHMPVLDLDEPINHADFGWRLVGSSHCSWPGPLIRVQPGQRYGLLVKGAPGTKTNLHFHGLHTESPTTTSSNNNNGDNILRVVGGSNGNNGNDDVLVYAINVPKYHMGGTHWYHSNLQGEMHRQVSGGAFGLLIVEDDHATVAGGGGRRRRRRGNENGDDNIYTNNNVGTNDPDVWQFLKREVMLVLDNGIKSSSSKSGSGRGPAPSRWMANGLEQEHFRLQRNEWYRMRILTVRTDSFNVGQVLSFGSGGDACQVHAVAHDGIFRFQVPDVTSRSDFILSTASRLDVAIRCQTSSTISVGTQQVATIHTFDPDDGDESTTTGSGANPFENGNQVWNSTRPPYLADLRNLAVDHQWKIHVDEVDINHQSWYMQRPLCDDKDKDFKYNSIQEWSITGLESQPLHVHKYPMQIVSDTGCGNGHVVGEFYDTLGAYGTNDVSRNCKVRVRLVDVTGPTVMQSHILEHSDQGSIGIFHVVGSGGPTTEEAKQGIATNGESPHVFRCHQEPCDQPESIITCSEW